MRKNTSILVVDDEEGYRALAELGMSELGWFVACAENAREAMRMIEKRGYDLALVDGYLGDSTGPDLVRRMIAARPGLKVLVYSVMHEDIAVEAAAAGALACLPKPARFEVVASFAERERA